MKWTKTEAGFYRLEGTRYAVASGPKYNDFDEVLAGQTEWSVVRFSDADLAAGKDGPQDGDNLDWFETMREAKAEVAKLESKRLSEAAAVASFDGDVAERDRLRALRGEVQDAPTKLKIQRLTPTRGWKDVTGPLDRDVASVHLLKLDAQPSPYRGFANELRIVKASYRG